MSTKTLLSLATIALFAATAKATQYSSDSTNDWFAVTASSAELSTEKGWTVPSDGEAGVGSTINVDTAAADPLKYTLPTEKLNATGIRIDGTISGIVLNASAPTAYESGTGVPQAAMVAVQGGNWYVWHCTDTDAGEWVATSTSSPTEGATCYVAIEFMAGYVRYGTATSLSAEPTWFTPTDCEEGGWISNKKTFTAMTAIGLAGYGSFGDFGGLVVKSVTIDTTSEALAAAITAGKYTTAALESDTPQENGLTAKQSVMLGLPSQITKPIPAPTQIAESGYLGFTISNANPSEYGASSYATLEVYEVATPGATPDGEPAATAVVGTPAKVAAPKANDGVKYYRVKINFH